MNADVSLRCFPPQFLSSGFTKILRNFSFLTAFLLSLTAANAHAVLINFDDLTYVPSDPEFPSFADIPITDQYLSKGLLIGDSYLLPYSAETDEYFVSGPNYLIGGNAPVFSFVGQLPTHVGMYVSSFSEESIFFEAYGTSGLLESKHTSGYAGPFDESSYLPKQYVSFDSVQGISSIQFWNFYGSRVSAAIDDLTFTYSEVEVPEPSSLVLLGLGIFALGYRRLKRIYK